MARLRELAGWPVEQHSSPNIGGAMSGHRGPVLHIAEGFYQGTISWQMNPDQRYRDGTRVTTSSTWIVGKLQGEIAQMVDTDTIAWTQGAGSRTRTSIELVGFAPDKPTAWQLEMCAQILAWEHRTYGVPLRVAAHDGEDGLGHHSMDREWLGVEWGHEACPGSGVIGAKAAIVARAIEIEEGDVAISSEDLDRIALAVWTKSNSIIGLTYGQMIRYLTNAVRPEYQQTPGKVLGFRKDLARLEELGEAMLAAHDGGGRTEILARIDAHHAERMAAFDQLGASLAGLPEAVAAELGDRDSAAVREAVERVLGRVRLGVEADPDGQ